MKEESQKLHHLAAIHGATITVDIDGLDRHETTHVDLPVGKHWLANETGMIIGRSDDMSQDSRKAALLDIIEEMEQGVTDCPAGGCDQCD